MVAHGRIRSLPHIATGNRVNPAHGVVLLYALILPRHDLDRAAFTSGLLHQFTAEVALFTVAGFYESGVVIHRRILGADEG